MIGPAAEHVLVSDVGGTHVGVAVFAHSGGGIFTPVVHETYKSREVDDYPSLLRRFLKNYADNLDPRVTRGCIGCAGPVDAGRSNALMTNLGWGFTSREIQQATGIEALSLMNDFEAVGYGVEILIDNHPETFVRLSESGRLPPRRGRKATAVVIGAGTGLGTTILIHDRAKGFYRPIPGEGGHADFVAVDEEEFQIAAWIRRNRNRSASNPIDTEKVVSGPGLINLYEALCDLEPELGRADTINEIRRMDPYDRPAVIVRKAGEDLLCRKALDIWLRCYARAAKNSALFPLAPGGVYLAGGIAAKMLTELQSGLFMREFKRCDVPNIRTILERTPVFVITDYRIGLYGCANIAVNPDLLG